MIASDEKLQNRLRSSIVENPSDLESPLTRACLREALRLYPVAPFIIRTLDSDATFDNYVVPKGWLTLASAYSSGRDPVNFSDPLKFCPDRWLREKNQTDSEVLKHHATLP